MYLALNCFVEEMENINTQVHKYKDNAIYKSSD